MHKTKKKISVMILKPDTADALCPFVEYLEQMGLDVYTYNADLKRTRKAMREEMVFFDEDLNGKDIVIIPSATIAWWPSLEKEFLRVLKKRGIPYLFFKTYWDGGWDNLWDNKLRLHQDEDPDDVLEKILTVLNRNDELSDLAKEGLKKSQYCGRYTYWMETKGASTEKKELTPDELKEHEEFKAKYGWTLRKEPVSLYEKHDYRARMRSELIFINENHLKNHFLGLHLLRSLNIPIYISRASDVVFGGLLLSYCLGITDLDPVKMNVVFERGLSSAPLPFEIHLDIAKSDRDVLENKIGSSKLFKGIKIHLNEDAPDYPLRRIVDEIIRKHPHLSEIELNDVKTMKRLLNMTEINSIPIFADPLVRQAMQEIHLNNFNDLCIALSMYPDQMYLFEEYKRRENKSPDIMYELIVATQARPLIAKAWIAPQAWLAYRLAYVKAHYKDVYDAAFKNMEDFK